MDPDPGGPKTWDPADPVPDPQHWLNQNFVNLMVSRESKLRMGVLEALAAITPFLSRETVLDKAGRTPIYSVASLRHFD
jgi:hypothetical protein